MNRLKLSLLWCIASLSFAISITPLLAGEAEKGATNTTSDDNSTRVDPRIQLKLAYELLEEKSYAEALSALSDITDNKIIALPLIRARALRGLGQNDAALNELEAAALQFPDEVAPKLELLALCKEMSLTAEARKWGEELLNQAPDEKRVLLVLEALYSDEAALPLLEKAAALFPGHAEVLYRLAYAYAAAHKYYAAARLFERATLAGRDASFEAADQYCTAGEDRRALNLNARVKDEKIRLRQRLRILASSRQFARLIALQSEIKRIGLNDPSIDYHFAYARFRLGQEERATQIARSLLDTPSRNQAVSLLQAMGRPLQSPK